MTLKSSLLAATALLAFQAPLDAALVVADFNDNAVGQLSNFTPGAGQAGGTGFDPDASNTWSNTGTIDAIAGDLTAPPSTNYAILQAGSGPVSAQGDFTEGRQATRALATTMTGTVWFSFLLNQPSADSRGGITFNQNGSSPANPRIVAVGTELRLALATIQLPGEGAVGSLTLGSTALVLGRVVIDPLGDEILDVWVDPDVSGGIAGLPAPATSLTEQTANLDAGITRLGIQTYGTVSDNQGGILDIVRLSDDANQNQAFFEVTGVLIPEPAAAVLALLGVFGVLRRRRS